MSTFLLPQYNVRSIFLNRMIPMVIWPLYVCWWDLIFCLGIHSAYEVSLNVRNYTKKKHKKTYKTPSMAFCSEVQL